MEKAGKTLGSELMIEDSNSLDDILPSAATSNARSLGKFRPKPRLKSKIPAPIAAPSNVAYATSEPPVEGANCSTSRTITSVGQPETLSIEGSGSASDANVEGVLEQRKQGGTKIADMVIDTERIDDLMQPASISGKFQPEVEPNTLSLKVFSSAAAFGNQEPVDVPAMSSCSSLPEAMSSGSWSQELHGTEVLALLAENPENGAQVPEGDSSVQTNFDQAQGEVADTFFSVGSFDDPIHPTSSSVSMEPVVSNHTFRSSPDLVVSSEVHSIHDLPCVTEEPTSVVQTYPQETACVFGTEQLDDLISQLGTTDSQVGEIQTKLVEVAPSKVGNAKSVSFLLPHATESVIPTVESHTSSHPNEETELPGCNPLRLGLSFSQMMNEDSINSDLPPSSTIAHCTIDLQMGEDDTPVLSSIDNLLSQPTLTTAQPRGKFQPRSRSRNESVRPKAPLVSQGVMESTPTLLDSHQPEIQSLEEHAVGFQPTSFPSSSKPGSCNSIDHEFSQGEAEIVKTSDVGSACPDGDATSQMIDKLSRSDGSDDGKGYQAVAGEPSNAAQSQDVDDLLEQILGALGSSDAVEDNEICKSSRKLRKRIRVHNPFGELDDRDSEDRDADFSGSPQMDEDHSDDEYVGDDVAKKKRTSKKSKRQTSEMDKPVRRHRKASEEPDSTIEQPKKKLPLGARRRRQVDKTLLATPEHEIDLRQISIKNLILLAEAKERIANKEAAIMGKPLPNQRATSPNQDQNNDEDANGDDGVQYSSRKLNYHSYMDRPQSTRWSKAETELFYQAIRQFGTDFAMIKQLFPNRTRHQVKLKFKSEERKHPLQLADAIAHPSRDNSHFELLIKQLQAQAELDEQQLYDPSVVFGNEVENERAKGGAEKDEVNGQEDEARNSVKTNDGEGEACSPAKSSVFGDGFDWDNETSLSQEGVKDILEGLFS